MRQIIFSFLFLVLISGIVKAQENQVWTMDECISYALDNNISLKRQELDTQLSKKDYAQSKLDLLPNMGGVIEHNLGTGRVLITETYEWLNTNVSDGRLGVQSSLTLFSGLRGYNGIQMSKAKFEMAQSNLGLLENNITLQVMTGYLDLLRKMELYDIAVEKSKITELQVIRMERLMEVGNASSGELLEVKAQHSNEKFNVTSANNNVQVSKLNLIHLLNLEMNPNFEISKPIIPDPSEIDIPNLDTVYYNSLNTLPQIKGAEQNIVFNEKGLAVAKGALSPELYLRGVFFSNYNTNLTDPFDATLPYAVPQQVYDHRYKQVTVGLNIPIFNRWQTNTNISKAKISVQDARYNMENEKQMLLQEIQQYYTDAVSALDNYNAASESFANSEEAYRYMEEKFKVGMATALELDEARNRLFASRSEMITAKYVFVFYSRILDFYQGKDISLG